MSYTWTWAAVAALGLGFGLAERNSAAGPVEPIPDDLDTIAVDRYVAARMSATGMPGLALAVVKGDDVVYLKGYGRADASGRPVTPQTPFIVGSITKPFTALGIMQLVEAGNVDLDAPVQRYLPWFRVADPSASKIITVRQLLYQTSGVSQASTLETWNWGNDADAMERHVRLLAHAALLGPPGQTFAYANANYTTLGVIIQAVSGESYEDYIREHIFAPLDMRHSYASQEEADQHGLAAGHRWLLGFPVAVTLPSSRANLPAGFLISGAEDMAHFAIAQMNGGQYRGRSILSPTGIALTHRQPAPNTYAMGWETTVLGGHVLVNHDGGTANYQASLFFDPDARVGVFIAANAISMWDAFSSPPGSSPLDGSTVRAMAETVLNIATNRPFPDQGIRLERLNLIVYLLVAALTVALIISVSRIPSRYRQLAARGFQSESSFVRRIGTTAALHFVWPLALLVVALTASYWVLIVMFQPDIVYWAAAVAVVVFLKGVLEVTIASRIRAAGRLGADQRRVAFTRMSSRA